MTMTVTATGAAGATLSPRRVALLREAYGLGVGRWPRLLDASELNYAGGYVWRTYVREPGEAWR